MNGSVNQGTFGGDTYYEMNKTPILGAGTNFTRTNGQGNGYIASFITDAGDPSLLNIPAGNWNLEFYFQSSASGGSPEFYGEIYKVSSSNVFTLVASGSANPEGITNGTTVDQYFTSISVPQTSLLLTDRLAIRIYVITGGRTITLHTENGNLCEVLTTFSTGLNALNGLTSQVQYLATGTSGTDFAISSATDTHTFNLPTASATNRGALSTTDWSTFNSKIGAGDTATMLTPYSRGSGTSGQVGYWNATRSLTGSSNLFWDNANGRLGIGTASPLYKLDVNGTARFVSGVNMATTSGSVGIGTASPISKLHIYEPSAAATFLLETNSATDYSEISARNASATSTSYFRQYSASASGTVLGNSVSNLSTFFSNFASNFAIGTLNGGNLILGTANTERMRIHSTSGNVLIGTTTDAGYKLDVNGTARVQEILRVERSTISAVDIVNSADSYRWRFGIDKSNNTTNVFALTKLSGGNAQPLQVYETGNVVLQGAGNLFNLDVASAQLQVSSTTKGFLPPRMTTSQKNAISSPSEGLQVYDLTLHQMSYFNGTIWINF